MAYQDEFKAFGAARRKAVYEIVSRDTTDGIDLPLVLAIGSRESNLRNVVGDGGHGRGFLQIDDRSHQQWLGTVRGCTSGSWEATFPTAHEAGRVPTLVDATEYAVGLLQDNLRFAAAKGVSPAARMRFAVAAYNCGPGNALKGYNAGNVDAHTTGGDYSADVLGKRLPAFAALVQAADGAGPRHLALTSPTRMVGDDVRRHQKNLNQRLAARDFARIEPDGEWGPQTDSANTRVKWLLGWPAGTLGGASPEDQSWIAKPRSRPQTYKAAAKVRWERVTEARRVRAERVKATLDWCKQQIGVHEEGGNNVGGKICEWQRDVWYGCGWAWCGAFVGYALKHYGKTPIVGERIISVEKIREDGALRRNGMAGVVEFEALKPGDLVIVDTAERGPYNHVGLYLGNGETVEGNTGPSADFPSNDGQGVYPKRRDPASFSAFVRPTYGVTLPVLGPVGLMAEGDGDALDVFTALVHDMPEADEQAIIDELAPAGH